MISVLRHLRAHYHPNPRPCIARRLPTGANQAEENGSNHMPDTLNMRSTHRDNGQQHPRQGVLTLFGPFSGRLAVL